MALSFVLGVVAVAHLARALPQGPPVGKHFHEVCDLMTPLHGGNVAMSGSGGFSLQTDLPSIGFLGFNYTAGNTYTGDLFVYISAPGPIASVVPAPQAHPPALCKGVM